jgi:hypothetical protein
VQLKSHSGWPIGSGSHDDAATERITRQAPAPD